MLKKTDEPLPLMFYLAQPIDFGEADPSLVNFVHGWLEGMNINTYRPAEAWMAFQPDPRVSQVNNEALRQADAVVAFLPSVKSYGVPAEVSMALARRTPVLVITDATDSFIVAGWDGDPLSMVVPMNREAIVGGLNELTLKVHDQQATRSMAGAFGLKVPEGSQPLVFEPVGADSPNHPEGTASKLPTRGYDDDAGFDLYVSATTSIPPGSFVDVPCGVKADLPEGCWGLITGRSSSLRKHGLLVSNGIIDNGYTGPLFAGTQNLTTHEVVINQGDRIAQLILLPTVAIDYRATWGEVSTKQRGERGFGSTGR